MIWSGALDVASPRRMMSPTASSAATAASEARDDNVKDGNDTRNNGLED